MARITPVEAQGWGERTKLDLSTLDTALCTQIEEEVLSRISSIYDTTTWLDQTSTPRLIRVIIAKMYVAWFYDRQYSENQDQGNDYAKLLKDNAEMLITGIIDGTITIPGTTQDSNSLPGYYPSDASSALTEQNNIMIAGTNIPDTSIGPSKFSMGQRF